jgi:hypothetical protein
LEVFNRQVKTSPGITGAITEIENPLHRNTGKKALKAEKPSAFRAIEDI